MTPHPELLRFEVPPGGFERVVLASDGLWDFCTAQQAARVARGARSAQAAAHLLAELAWNVSHAKLDRLKDDTTVLVVDLDLSPPGEKSEKGGADGCCVVA